MKKFFLKIGHSLARLMQRLGIGYRGKLITIFLVVQIVPLVFLTVVSVRQAEALGEAIKHTALTDFTEALTSSSVENIERLTTDTAKAVANFLYDRDADLRFLAKSIESNYLSTMQIDSIFKDFIETKTGNVVSAGEWVLSSDGRSWVRKDPQDRGQGGTSSNSENDERFHSQPAHEFDMINIPLYDEITFITVNNNIYSELVKASTDRKIKYPLNKDKIIALDKSKTYVKAETYLDYLQNLQKGEIYVSDVIGAYVGTNYIGMYTQAIVNEVALSPGRLHPIPYSPLAQAYAGMENPNGQKFEGIVRWAMPVYVNDVLLGYVTMALNHEHIMEMVDHITPMLERYTEIPSAFAGNYAFIWDYKCRSIAHPRHHSIVGYDPTTGEESIPWLESSIFTAWLLEGGISPTGWPVQYNNYLQQASYKVDDKDVNYVNITDWSSFYKVWLNSGNPSWTDYVKSVPEFSSQSRKKAPAFTLTRIGQVALDGRYLNNAPQCTGWMDLTKDGGSGSFYIVWSNLNKLTTAAAIPYYTGQYAPSTANDFSRRGFGFVTIGAGLDDFMEPVNATDIELVDTIQANYNSTILRLLLITLTIVVLIILIAIWISSILSNSLLWLSKGFSRYKQGERQFRFNATIHDEFGRLADVFNDMADNIEKSVSGALAILNTEKKIVYMNEVGLKLCRKTLDELVGQPYSENSVYPTKSIYCPLLALEENREAEVLYIPERDEFVKGSAHYLYDENNNISGYVVVSTDVTEIQVARTKAENASKAKSDFLSNMSHEIRTPMNAIIGMTSIGKHAEDIERKDYCLTKIEEASSHLLSIINDILDMSKIEAKKFTISSIEFNFEKMLKKVVDIISFRIDEKQQELDVYVDRRIPSNIYADEQRIIQIIANLMTNAVKFTPEGGRVTLRTRLVSQNSDETIIEVKVIDTGIGISKEQQSRLFASFEQADSNTSRKFGGTGLGLVISKNIIEMMGGKITLESELGQGAIFTFTIKVQAGSPLANEYQSWPGLRVIVVDKRETSSAFFKDFAERFGLSCDVAQTESEAMILLNQAMKFNQPYHFGFVADDLDTSIYTTINHFPKNSIKNLVVIASSTKWNVLEQVAKDYGFVIDSFIPVPVFPSSIHDTINHILINQSEVDEVEVEKEEIVNFEGYRILVAEDIEINREIVAALLEPTMIEIDFAENGVRALQMFENNPTRYDLIFMDLQMPEMDGFETVTKIRALPYPTAQSVPIIAMTANVFTEDIEKCLQVKMNDHIGKPFDISTVIKKLNKYLPERK